MNSTKKGLPYADTQREVPEMLNQVTDGQRRVIHADTFFGLTILHDLPMYNHATSDQ
jgi:hypothetical protein